MSADWIKIWSKKWILMTCQLLILSKLKACVNEYSLIKKTNEETGIHNVLMFKFKLNLLLYIAYKNADVLILIDKVFKRSVECL